MSPPPRIIHLHIPKTAGTALRLAFEAEYSGRIRVFSHWDESRYVGIDPNDYDFYSGHFGYETALRLGGNIVTVLRNPIERFLSVYYFWRQLYETGAEISTNTELASKFSLAQFVMIRDEPLLIEEFVNRATYQLARGSNLDQRRSLLMEGKSEQDVYDSALRNLSTFAAVGLQEDLPLFSRRIFEKFGCTLNIGRDNVTENRAAAQDVPVSIRTRIHRWVGLDIELYNAAKKYI